MSMRQALRQMPARAGREAVGQGEALAATASDEACGPRHATGRAGSALLEAALRTENLRQAFKRVRANRGAAGVDGRDIDETSRHLASAWPQIRAQLLAGTYRPSPVRRVTIPKPDGGERELGIPTVVDRLIQQALLQVLQPLLDPTFSEHSYGFRPGKRAHDAVLAAQAYVQLGQRVVVDVDLAQFFDRVNHDILIDRLRKRIDDAGVIRLIRAYLNSGIMDHGVVQERHEGMPQGGPLSPLMALLRGCYAKLHLQINEGKSAVGSVFGRKFLGYSLWVSSGGEVKRKVAEKPVATFKQRIRELTSRSGGRSMPQTVAKLRSYMLGWKGYFRLAQTPKVWRELDEWLRHRLRAIQLKHWRRGTTMYRELLKLGASAAVAKQVAANSRRWWRNSDRLVKSVLTIAYFDHLGVPRLS